MTEDSLKNPEVSKQFRKNDDYGAGWERIFGPVEKESSSAAFREMILLPWKHGLTEHNPIGPDFRQLYETAVKDRALAENEIRRLNVELTCAKAREDALKAKLEGPPDWRELYPPRGEDS